MNAHRDALTAPLFEEPASAPGALGCAIEIAATMAEALELAVMLADTADGQAGVLVAGSVIAAGEARDLLVAADEGEER